VTVRRPVELVEALDLINRWWFAYDECRFDVLAGLVTADVGHSSRTDTGNHPFEDFIRVVETGRDPVIAHLREHRAGSPYPLRHNATNVHIVDERGEEVEVASYLFVTNIVDGTPSALSSGICTFTVRREPDDLCRLAQLDVVLDFEATGPST
jgi:hypothetical protein